MRNCNLITVIILTYNEEKHLQRCIDSFDGISAHFIIIDSFSSDKTEEIALKNGCCFIQHKWKNYATQLNWAIENCPIKTHWTMRMDADEYLNKTLNNEIKNFCSNNQDIDGAIVTRVNIYYNKIIKYGTSSIKLLRIWKTGTAFCEKKWMDEHMNFYSQSPAVLELEGELVDHNLNSFRWWVEKVNNYALREAIDYFMLEHKNNKNEKVFNLYHQQHANKQAYLKNKLKKYVYYKFPLFIRPVFLFIYIYFFKLGFLDGKIGFIFHLRQTLWYRMMVDFFILEINYYSKCMSWDIEKTILHFYGVAINAEIK